MLAIKGGYKGKSKDGSSWYIPTDYEVVCSKDFWEALGRSLEWTETQYRNLESSDVQYRTYQKTGAIYHALTFHEVNMLDGWDAALNWLRHAISERQLVLEEQQ